MEIPHAFVPAIHCVIGGKCSRHVRGEEQLCWSPYYGIAGALRPRLLLWVVYCTCPRIRASRSRHRDRLEVGGSRLMRAAESLQKVHDMRGTHVSIYFWQLCVHNARSSDDDETPFTRATIGSRHSITWSKLRRSVRTEAITGHNYVRWEDTEIIYLADALH